MTGAYGGGGETWFVESTGARVEVGAEREDPSGRTWPIGKVRYRAFGVFLTVRAL